MSAFAYSRAVYLVSQILLVPLFVSRWGAALYGEWLALTALAVYLSYCSFGLAQVIRSEMSLAHASGGNNRVARIFQTSLVVVVGMCAMGAAIFWLILSHVDLSGALNLASTGRSAAGWIVGLFCTQIIALLIFGVVSAGLSALGAYDLATALDANRQLLELIALGVVVGLLREGPQQAAMVYPATAALTLLISLVLTVRRAPWLFASFTVVPMLVVRLWRPILGTFLLNFGYTGLIVQAPRLILASTVGPAAVASYAISTMLLRLARIPIEVPSFSATVEISTAFGKGDLALARQLIRDTTRFSIWMALIIIPCVIVAGPIVVHFWSVGQIEVDRPLLAILGIATIAFATGLPAQEGLMALNRLMGVTVWLILLAIPFLLFCYEFSHWFGTLGAGVATALLELVFAVLAARQCLRLFDYDPRAYLRSLTPPTEIVAAASNRARESVARKFRERGKRV